MPTLQRHFDGESYWQNLRGHLWLQESHYPLSDRFILSVSLLKGHPTVLQLENMNLIGHPMLLAF